MASGTFDDMDLGSVPGLAAGRSRRTSGLVMGTDAEIEPPYRQVGGAPPPGVLEGLIDRGLPATCPEHGVWPFRWVGRDAVFHCPRDNGRCTAIVEYSDLVSSADGGDVFW